MDDEVGLEVEVAGDGPALVLVHGFGGAKEDFADHVEALGDHFRVVTFDLRGHGASDGPDDTHAYSLDRFAADTVAVADAAGFDRFRLLGHSMGGMAARRIVLGSPERVEALVLMDTSAGAPPGIDPDVADLGAGIALEQGKQALKPLLDEVAALETPAYRRLVHDRPAYKDFEAYKWESISIEMWAAMAHELTHQPDELAAMAGVRCPTLVTVGELDEQFLQPSRDLAATIPGARYVEIPDAGHSPQFENPTVWFDAVDGFLRELDAVEAAKHA